MTFTAKFIGTDSLGYVHGNTYDLYVVWNTIHRLNDHKGGCMYATLGSFLKNWTDIKIIKQCPDIVKIIENE